MAGSPERNTTGMSSSEAHEKREPIYVARLPYSTVSDIEHGMVIGMGFFKVPKNITELQEEDLTLTPAQRKLLAAYKLETAMNEAQRDDREHLLTVTLSGRDVEVINDWFQEQLLISESGVLPNVHTTELFRAFNAALVDANIPPEKK